MLDSFVHFLKFCGYLAVMLAIVPLAGFCVSGSWRAAWHYTKGWLQVMGIMIALAGVVFMAFVGIIGPG